MIVQPSVVATYPRSLAATIADVKNTFACSSLDISKRVSPHN